MEKFVIGALVGGIVGALAVSNNAKMRALVKKGEEELREKAETAVDEKLSALLKKCEEKEKGGEAKKQKNETPEKPKKVAKAEKKSAKKEEKG